VRQNRIASAVRALGVVLVGLAGSAGLVTTSIGCAPPPVLTADRHVLPNGLIEVRLEDFDRVSYLDVDLHTAVQTREAVEAEFKNAYGTIGHPRWFFHAFDDRNLDFIVARFEPTEHDRVRYVAERRLRVKRTKEAEAALGVSDVVAEYEVGTNGLKAGMSPREVGRIAGHAETGRPLGPPGAYELRYAAYCVQFLEGRAAHIWGRDQCW
jgi:hypothetical protein